MNKIVSLIVGITGLSIVVFYQVWHFLFSLPIYNLKWFDSMNVAFPLFWIGFFIISLLALTKKIPSLVSGAFGLFIVIFYQLWHLFKNEALHEAWYSNWFESMNYFPPLFWIGVYCIIISALAALFRSFHFFEYSEKNYLTHPKGIMSWILTLDHKRIGLMYLVSGIIFFFLG